MQLVKHLLISISPEGAWSIGDKVEANHKTTQPNEYVVPVYRGVLKKDMDLVKTINNVIPHHIGRIFEAIADNNIKYGVIFGENFSFRLEKGAKGDYTAYYNDPEYNKDFQLFYYAPGSVISSISILTKLYGLIELKKKEKKYKEYAKKVMTLFSDASDMEMLSRNKDHGIRGFDSSKYYMSFIFTHENKRIIVAIDKDDIKVLGHVQHSYYDHWDYYTLVDIDAIEAEKVALQRDIEELSRIQDKISTLRNRVNDTSVPIEPISNKRHMDLKKTHTRELLSLLQCLRTNYRNDEFEYPTMEEVKAELAHREHIPNKKEAKEIRRQKAIMGKRGRKDK